MSRTPGGGWAVAGPRIGEPPNQLMSFSEMAASRGLTPAPASWPSTSGRPRSTRRTRSASRRAPRCSSRATAADGRGAHPRRPHPDPPRAGTGHRPGGLLERLLYAVLEERYGIRPARATFSVEAIAADERLATLLELEPGAAAPLRPAHRRRDGSADRDVRDGLSGGPLPVPRHPHPGRHRHAASVRDRARAPARVGARAATPGHRHRRLRRPEPRRRRPRGRGPRVHAGCSRRRRDRGDPDGTLSRARAPILGRLPRRDPHHGLPARRVRGYLARRPALAARLGDAQLRRAAGDLACSRRPPCPPTAVRRRAPPTTARWSKAVRPRHPGDRHQRARGVQRAAVGRVRADEDGGALGRELALERGVLGQR